MRIVIVEDQPMFREVLRKVVTELNLTLAGETGEGKAAVEVIAAAQPDLLLLDLQLPGLDGFDIAKATNTRSPATRILVLSSHCDEVTVNRLEQAGVQGFVDKNTNTIEVLKAGIFAVAAGESAFSVAFRRTQEKLGADPRAFDKVLTNRECAVLALLAIPLTDDAIARSLGISIGTVEKHHLSALRKLNLGTTAGLIRYARERGFQPFTL